MNEDEKSDARCAHERNADFLADFNKAAIETANVVIRSPLLINGWCCGRPSGLRGAVESGGASVKSELPADPILRFVMGVAMSVVTAFLAYIVNFADAWATGSRKTVSHNPYIQKRRRRSGFLRSVLSSTSLPCWQRSCRCGPSSKSFGWSRRPCLNWEFSE